MLLEDFYWGAWIWGEGNNSNELYRFKKIGFSLRERAAVVTFINKKFDCFKSNEMENGHPCVKKLTPVCEKTDTRVWKNWHPSVEKLTPVCEKTDTRVWKN